MDENFNNENYIDYIVEDDMIETPKKSLSICKIIAMVLGIISGLCLLYYSIDALRANVSQIAQYKQMGMEIPGINLFVIYFQLALLFIASLSSIIGGVLPVKYSKLSILLLTFPASWTLINALPQLILSISFKTPMAEAYQVVLISLSGALTLAAAIVNLFADKKDYCDCDECMCELYDEIDEDFMDDIFEEENEVIEEVTEEVAEEEVVAEEVSEESQDEE